MTPDKDLEKEVRTLQARFDDLWQSLYASHFIRKSEHADERMRSLAKHIYAQGCRHATEDLLEAARERESK